MERLMSPSNFPPHVGKLRDSQIAQRGTWAQVPDHAVVAAAMHIIHVRPAGSSTVTELNPLDPGTVQNPDDPPGDTYLGWLVRPGDPGRVVPAGRS